MFYCKHFFVNFSYIKCISLLLDYCLRHICLMVSFPGQPGKVQQSEFRQEIMVFWYGSGISWTIIIQTICTMLQTDNHTNTSSLNFAGWVLFLTPSKQCQSLKAFC